MVDVQSMFCMHVGVLKREYIECFYGTANQTIGQELDLSGLEIAYGCEYFGYANNITHSRHCGDTCLMCSINFDPGNIRCLYCSQP